MKKMVDDKRFYGIMILVHVGVHILTRVSRVA